MISVGIDIGSTTIKAVVLDGDNITFSCYERHFSKISEKLSNILSRLENGPLKGQKLVKLAFTGSAGMGISEACHFPFYQEVYATRECSNLFYPETDCIIELGGEDAKILFLKNGVEVRMNGTCAGGTGAFIDQMATLLNVKIEDMDALAKGAKRTYTIASRCGVFAKSDIQPLLNQGAEKEDIAKSIFNAVVNQTIAGLSQGREVKGHIMYLGGPLTFLSELRKSFDDILKVEGILPENSLYFVAIGAALLARKDEEVDISTILNKVDSYRNDENFAFLPPLFKDEQEYAEFKERHDKDRVQILPLKGYEGELYLGVDCGSTTIKMVALDSDYNIRYSNYVSNQGDPIPLLKMMLEEIYQQKEEKATIRASASTGYGEDLVKNAFSLDGGLVETMAHLEAAKHFMPDVEFVIDIGGQDIKCFKIRNGAIDDIFLNEACSSGCGSFLQSFATSLGYTSEEFAKLALFAKRPVNLGSRCTVFMNSSVKQAQKDGATINDIAAGLSISVVKNALYKVIRCGSKDDLGKKIVVQGGTFLNDAVLRSFETELDCHVVRSNIAGLMGAYGAALYAMDTKKEETSTISKDGLAKFQRKIVNSTCGLCNNHCKLTINRFDDKRIYIGGNRCERPITKKATEVSNSIYDFKYKLLRSYNREKEEEKQFKRGKLGLPMGLNFYELTPFWATFFTSLGFQVVLSDHSSNKLYSRGQMTIPSDTVCYPAKLLHGHVLNLIDKGVKTIFYPCMTWNIKEKHTDNHYNCPVVAYYSEVISANTPQIKENGVTYIKEYVNLYEKAHFPEKVFSILKNYFPDLKRDEVDKAASKAYREYEKYQKIVFSKGQHLIQKARKDGKMIIVLAGRPYHVDPLINHGIDRLLLQYNCVVVSEDVIAPLYTGADPVRVLNQWTYHSRMYKAAMYIADKKDMQLMQLVSFGCGVDAVTSDEVRDILERNNKIYTQIKIDEVTNLGTVKIRIRSLLEALRKRK